jgi:hypothetical protein
MIETMKKTDLIRMLVTMWAIWHAKRKDVHEEVYQSPSATVTFVSRFLEDLGEVKNTCDSVQPKEPKQVQKKWIAPPAGITKINVDAAVAKSVAKGAVGVVCRSADGVFLGASAVVFDGITHPGSLEALA